MAFKLGFKTRHFHGGLTVLGGAAIAIAFDKLKVSGPWEWVLFLGVLVVIGCGLARLDLRLEEEAAEEERRRREEDLEVERERSARAMEEELARDRRDVCEFLDLAELYTWSLAEDFYNHRAPKDLPPDYFVRPVFRDLIPSDERYDRIRQWFYVHEFDMHLDAMKRARTRATEHPEVHWSSKVHVIVEMWDGFLESVRKQDLEAKTEYSPDLEGWEVFRAFKPSPRGVGESGEAANAPPANP